MKPTIGRIVYYKSRGSLDGVFPPQDFASIVTKVSDDGSIGLATFSENGMRFEHDIVQGQSAGNWDWMPFQKDQQARVGYSSTPVGATEADPTATSDQTGTSGAVNITPLPTPHN